MSKPTPRPWIVRNLVDVYSNDGRCIVLGDDACPVNDTDEANAAHIVKCVNMHDELVAALSGCLRCIEDGLNDEALDEDDETELGNRILSAVEESERLLAKAKE